MSASDYFCLNPRYSTTRVVTDVRTHVENNPTSRVQTKVFSPAIPERQGEGGLRTQGYFKKSFSDKPLISVITVVFNGDKYLKQTIQSVLGQSYDNVEYIIIDGGSTDGTLDIIKKYEEAIDYWVSEPDSGIADAWNKGILASTGDIIGLINSDDWCEPDAVEQIVAALHKDKDASVVHGDRKQWNKTGTKLKGIVSPASRIDKLLPYTVPINHPTCFVRRQIYQRYGLFNKKYKSAMDHEFLLRLSKSGVKFVYVKKVITNMRSGGASYSLRGLKESREIGIMNGAKRCHSYFYYYKRAALNRFAVVADMLKLKGVLGYFYRKLNRRYTT